MSQHYFDTRRAKIGRAAAALSYDPAGTEAPQIVAAGGGLVAERIIALAHEHGIPLHQDAALVEALARLEIGTVIPPALYVVVAEILAFVYAVDAAAAGR